MRFVACLTFCGFVVIAHSFISLLPVGDYTVTAEAPGFKISTIQNLTLQVGQDARLDTKLALRTAADSVQVTASALFSPPTILRWAKSSTATQWRTCRSMDVSSGN